MVAAFGFIACAMTFALAALPACNECDSSIDPVKCSDLCTQDPPHADCAQCRGSVADPSCPQCQGPVSERAANCPSLGSGGSGGSSDDDGGLSGGAGGMTGGSGGNGGAAGTTGGSGGTTGGSGGVGGMVVPASCDDDDECNQDLPVCGDEGECVPCEDSAVCVARFAETNPHCDSEDVQGRAGACVECLSGDDCGNATPNCVDGRCEECASHAHCDQLQRPQCSAENECVACDGDEACEDRGVRAHCDTRTTGPTPGQCVECEEHDDCTDIANPQCNSDGLCGPCTDDDDACAGREDEGTPLTKCNLRSDSDTFGECVQCTGDSATTPASDACGTVSPTAFACNQETGRCTTKRVSRTDVCLACVADSECDPGTKCVPLAFNGNDFGSYCLRDKAMNLNACGDVSTTMRPYNRSVPETSIDGYAATYCMPSTSCEAVMDATSAANDEGKICTSDPNCGRGNATMDGANCVNFGDAEDHCSYNCTSDDDCPDAAYSNCSTGGYCEPN